MNKDMDKEKVMERLHLFLNNKLKAFIIDRYDNYYFCWIKDVNEVLVSVKSFAGNREGREEDILLDDIKEIKLYKPKY